MDFMAWYLLSISVFLISAGLTMVYPHKLSKRLKRTISEVGIMHFTTKEAAQKIIETSVIKENKIFHCAYFFQNGTVPEDAISHNSLKNKKIRVEILNLTDEQLNHLRIRYYDMAVVNFGDFEFSEENKVSIKTESDITPLRIALLSNFFIGVALLFVGAVAFLKFVCYLLCYNHPNA